MPQPSDARYHRLRPSLAIPAHAGQQERRLRRADADELTDRVQMLA